MRRILFILLLMFLSAFPAFAAGQGSAPDSSDEDMIIWEQQNWEPNGGYNRLTIWRDGRSEVEVAPLALVPAGQMNLRPKNGWTMIRQGHKVIFLSKNVYPPELARAKFRQAVEAGIGVLETFRAGYLDGNGTRVVVQLRGQRKTTIIPMFMDKERGTANHQRFLAVSKILDGFDTDACEWSDR